MFRLLFSDVSYFSWGIMFVMYAFGANNNDAPTNLSKLGKIFYFDISRMFRSSKNPNTYIMS